jgi:very-short-patch-repair endonuclease
VSWLGNCTRCGEPTISTKDPRYWPSETTSAAQSAALWQYDHLSSYGPDGEYLGVFHRNCSSPARRYYGPGGLSLADYHPAAQPVITPEVPGSEAWLWQKHSFIYDAGCGQEDCTESCYDFEGHLGYAEVARAAGFGRDPDFDDPEYQRWLFDTFAPPLSLVPGPLPESASPIEKQFWDAHGRLALPELEGLVFQHRVGRFRLDFALPDRMIGVELDGFRNHSKREDLTRDHARQRWLGGRRWYVIRFGGSEVHQDAENCVRDTASQVLVWGREA